MRGCSGECLGNQLMLGQDQMDLQELTLSSVLFGYIRILVFWMGSVWSSRVKRTSRLRHIACFVFISLQYALLRQLFVRCTFLSDIDEDDWRCGEKCWKLCLLEHRILSCKTDCCTGPSKSTVIWGSLAILSEPTRGQIASWHGPHELSYPEVLSCQGSETNYQSVHRRKHPEKNVFFMYAPAVEDAQIVSNSLIVPEFKYSPENLESAG